MTILTPDRKQVFEGPMPAIPRVGDYVYFIDGSPDAFEVTAVLHVLSSHPDRDDRHDRGVEVYVKHVGDKESLRRQIEQGHEIYIPEEGKL